MPAKTVTAQKIGPEVGFRSHSRRMLYISSWATASLGPLSVCAAEAPLTKCVAPEARINTRPMQNTRSRICRHRSRAWSADLPSPNIASTVRPQNIATGNASSINMRTGIWNSRKPGSHCTSAAPPIPKKISPRQISPSKRTRPRLSKTMVNPALIHRTPSPEWSSHVPAHPGPMKPRTDGTQTASVSPSETPPARVASPEASSAGSSCTALKVAATIMS